MSTFRNFSKQLDSPFEMAIYSCITVLPYFLFSLTKNLAGESESEHLLNSCNKVQKLIYATKKKKNYHSSDSQGIPQNPNLG
jgi:hypothetical protein